VNINLTSKECQEIIDMYEEIINIGYDKAIEKYKELGCGGHFSEVYLTPNRKYALKIFVDYNLDDDEDMQCNDPYVLKDLQKIEIEGRYILPSLHAYLPDKFMVMEFIEGIELEYQPYNKIDLQPDFWDIFFKGIKAIYQAGYMHKDLHSNNIMVTKDGFPKIIDVGAYYKHHNKEKIKEPNLLNEQEYREYRSKFRLII